MVQSVIVINRLSKHVVQSKLISFVPHWRHFPEGTHSFSTTGGQNIPQHDWV